MYDISLSYQKTAALNAAIKLDIFTTIGNRCLSVEQIADVTGGSLRGVRILCDYQLKSASGKGSATRQKNKK